MRIHFLILFATALLLSSCATGDSAEYFPTSTGQAFQIKNPKGEKLFDVTAPIGEWEFYDRSKEKVSQEFEFMYQGPHHGMTNAEIRIAYTASGISRTMEESRNTTTIAYLNKSMVHLLDKNNPNNLQEFYKPSNLEHGIRNIAGIHCRYLSITNHSGPTLDTPTAEFRGLGSGRKEIEYLCPVMRGDKLWHLGVDIVYSLSDVAIQKGLNIDFYEMIQEFDAMLKPTLDSLKLYGELKQY